ncbi:MAG: recombinase family protein, partial [Clostridia bacterium]|nr:recombinase family protein [Clostridia bacterium]
MGVTAVAYARYSSDGQRDESIDAQVRAIKSFAEREGYALIHVYADRGISGTSDNREEFQRMIEDAKNGDFQVVIVHKLDRFARNRSDSAIYRNVLEKYGVRLVSVLENFDDSPESIILQSVIEGYNEYYSKNLAREVMKGLKENALSAKFNGGVPPLGYDINKESLKYKINDFEAEAVKLIFKMYLQGDGYTSIINELNRRGFRTKLNNRFGKNSLYDILRNERYVGTYIYNKSVSLDAEKKFNR